MRKQTFLKTHALRGVLTFLLIFCSIGMWAKTVTFNLESDDPVLTIDKITISGGEMHGGYYNCTIRLEVTPNNATITNISYSYKVYPNQTIKTKTWSGSSTEMVKIATQTNWFFTSVTVTYDVTTTDATFGESTVTTADLTAAKNSTTAYNATIGRTFYKDGGNNTICLPFSLTATELAASPLSGYSKLQEFSSATIVNKGAQDETLELTMTDATAIEAGKPYIIAWESGDNIVNPVFEGVTITADEGSKSTASNGVQFCGTLVPFAMTAGDKGYMFVGQSAQLNWPDVDGNLKAFRCYFSVDLSSSAKLFRGMNAYLVDGTETNIKNLNDNQIENLRVKKLLEQGKVVIISNGKRYSLDGKPME